MSLFKNWEPEVEGVKEYSSGGLWCKFFSRNNNLWQTVYLWVYENISCAEARKPGWRGSLFLAVILPFCGPRVPTFHLKIHLITDRSRLSSATKKCFLQPRYCVIFVLLDSEFFIMRSEILPVDPSKSCSLATAHFKLFYASYLCDRNHSDLLFFLSFILVAKHNCKKSSRADATYGILHAADIITLSKFKLHFSPSDSEWRIPYHFKLKQQ
jgi:hypothetical protein